MNLLLDSFMKAEKRRHERMRRRQEESQQDPAPILRNSIFDGHEHPSLTESPEEPTPGSLSPESVSEAVINHPGHRRSRKRRRQTPPAPFEPSAKPVSSQADRDFGWKTLREPAWLIILDRVANKIFSRYGVLAAAAIAALIWWPNHASNKKLADSVPKKETLDHFLQRQVVPVTPAKKEIVVPEPTVANPPVIREEATKATPPPDKSNTVPETDTRLVPPVAEVRTTEKSTPRLLEPEVIDVNRNAVSKESQRGVANEKKEALATVRWEGKMPPHRPTAPSITPPATVTTPIEGGSVAPDRNKRPAVALMDQEQPFRLSHLPARKKSESSLKKARLAIQSGQLDQAQKGYEQVLTLEPDNKEALMGLASLAIQNNRYENAKGYYDRILEKVPNDTDALVGRIGVTKSASPLQRISQIKQLLVRTPDNAQLYFILGSTYASQQQWNLAQPALQSAFRLNPGNPDIPFNLGVALDHLGKIDEALNYYRLALQAAGSRTVGFDRAALQRRIHELGTRFESAVTHNNRSVP